VTLRCPTTCGPGVEDSRGLRADELVSARERVVGSDVSKRRRFNVLGPVRAWRGSAEVSLGSPQQKAVLAALLLRSGRQVPLSELVEALWGAEPPDSAGQVVRTYVYRLRRALAGGDGTPVIDSVGTGYLMHLTPDELDVAQFRQRLAAADAARRGGEPAAAAEELRQALALWQGDALAGLPGRYAEAQRAGLDKLRLAALATLLTLEVERDAAGAAAELAALVADHPLDERFRLLQMRALYRSGQQAAALAVYRDTQAVLAEELGVDPGPQLQQLYLQILRGDPEPPAPAGAGPATTTPDGAAPNGPAPDGAARNDPARNGPEQDQQAAADAAPAGPPAQLPADLPTFTGRRDELARVMTLQAEPPNTPPAVAVCTISGTAGVGKTTLAVHWAHQVRDRFPDGQLYLNLRGFDASRPAMSTAEALSCLLTALGVPARQVAADGDAQVAQYRSALAGRRVLIVLDNAREADQVRPLLPGAPGCLAIVTSRNHLTGLIVTDGAHPLTLDLLSPAEAREFLARRLGAARVAAEPAAAGEIAERCSRLPLALAVVAARAATHPAFPLHAIAAELAETGDSLDAFTGGDATSDIRAVFSWSYQALEPAAARLFRLLALHPGPDVAAPAAAALAGLPVGRTRPLLAVLAGLNLITEHLPGRYRWHDLLRTYAAELAAEQDSDGERAAALHRTLDHYLHNAHAAARLFSPGRTPMRLPSPLPDIVPEPLRNYRQAMTWLTAQRAILSAAVEVAAGGGFETYAYRLAWALDLFYFRQGYWLDWLAVRGIALAAAQRMGDAGAVAESHRDLGHALSQFGRLEEARGHFQQALEHLALGTDHTAHAHTHRGLSLLGLREGDYDRMLYHSERAAELYRLAGNRSGLAKALNESGYGYALRGDHRRALANCEQALPLFRELGDRHGEAATLDSLGVAHHNLGAYQQAHDHYTASLRLFREVDDLNGIAETLDHLADTHRAAGDEPAARAAWQEALELLDQLQHPGAGSVRDKLAGLRQAAGR
jgi:DNA-binding SARP family transcriptional activator